MLKESLQAIEELHLMGNKITEITVCSILIFIMPLPQMIFLMLHSGRDENGPGYTGD